MPGVEYYNSDVNYSSQIHAVLGDIEPVGGEAPQEEVTYLAGLEL